MNKHRTNKAVVFLLILLISISLSSCKKEESKENKSVVSTLLKNEYNGENSLIEIPLSQNEEVLVSTEKESNINRDETVPTDSFILDNTTNNIEDDSISALVPVTLNEEELVHVELEEEEENKAFSRILSLYNTNIDISIYDSYSIVLYPDNIDNNYVISFIEYVLSIYPSLIDSVTYTLKNGEVLFNYPEGFIGDDSWKESVVLEFNKLLEEYINNKEEKDYTTYKYILYDKDLTILLSKDELLIENINTFSNEEINEIKDLILTNYPELSLLNYTIINNQLVVTYPETIDIYSYITTLSSIINNDEIKKEKIIVNEVIEHNIDEEKNEEKVIEEDIVTFVSDLESVKPVLDEKESVSENIEEIVEAPTEKVEPITEKGRSVKKYELAISYSPDLTISSPIFTNHYANVRFLYSLSDNFKLGLSASYDFKNNLPLSIVAKYYLNETIYAYLEGGNTFILNEALKPNYFVQLGLGYDYKVSENINIFAELGLKYSFSDYKLTPKVSFGGSILF